MDQSSDVTSIIFFIISCKIDSLQKSFQLFLLTLQKLRKKVQATTVLFSIDQIDNWIIRSLVAHCSNSLSYQLLYIPEVFYPDLG